MTALKGLAARFGPGRLDAASERSLLDGLDADPCGVCAAVEESVASWFLTYEVEGAADPAVQDQLCRTLGLCPAHTRRLLGLGVPARWLATALFCDVARTGAALLADPARARAGRRDPCPPCAVARRRAGGLLEVLRGALDGSVAVRAAYAAGSGLCVTHATALLTGGTGVAAARTVATTLAERLGASPQVAVTTLAGVDSDVRRRAAAWAPHRDALLAAEDLTRRTSTAAYLDLVLTTPACPPCAARLRAEWRFLDRLAATDTPAATLRLDAILCPAHLADFVPRCDPGGEDDVVGYLADRVRGGLGRADDVLRGLPVRPRDRLRAALRGRLGAALVPRRVVGAVVTPAVRADRCKACETGAAAERAELALLGVVGEDPGRTADVGAAHGLCLRHGLSPAATAPWRALLSARLRLLALDLDAAKRNAAWDGRWRPRGAEMTAWRAAADLLDGTIRGPRPAVPGERPRGAW